MSTPVFIGDEVSACGYRLAGLTVMVPGREDPALLLEAACAAAPLVLLEAGFARRLPRARLEAALAGLAPPVVVVPDVRGREQPEDLSLRLRRQLEVAE